MRHQPTPLRLIGDQADAAGEPARTDPIGAALRLVGSDRGALARRSRPRDRAQLLAHGLSRAEEAACLDLVERLWNQSSGGNRLAQALGGGVLLAQRVEAVEGDAALVVFLPGGSGRLPPERLRALVDVTELLSAKLSESQATERLRREAAAERRRAERALALNHALQTLATTEDVTAACALLLAELEPQFTGIAFSAVWLLDPDERRLRLVAERGAVAGEALPRELPAGGAQRLAEVIETGESRVLTPKRGARTAEARLARHLGVASLLFVPLRSRNRVTGVLSLGAGEQREYSADERSFLEVLGAQLGGRLDGVRQLELAETERKRLQALIETLPVGIAIVDLVGRVTLWNRAAEEVWGQAPSAGEQRGRTVPRLLTADGRQLSPDETPVGRVLRGDTPEEAQELVVRRADGGHEVVVLVNAVPIRDAQARITGAIVVYQDISRLREIDRLKDDFINTVSHELRTPTTTIRGGALTLLKRGDQLEPEVRRQLLRDMAEEAERLYHLVEDLLSLSRAQAGMQMHLEPLILHRFINDVILDLGRRVGGGHPLSVEVPETVPLVDADPTVLEQVLRNLLENAAKFSPKGERIELSAEARGHDVLISVLDRGKGIPPDELDRVFEPFYRTAEAVRTGQQGAGLGLAVSLRLIQLLGGRIWAEPRQGGGTAFRFTLPALVVEGEE
jgi:PAS domain S-box-containing protein